MSTHSPEAIERVAEAIKTADKTSWKHEGDYQTFEEAEWSLMLDDTVYVPYEGISLGRDHYRELAEAALTAVESLYDDEGDAA